MSNNNTLAKLNEDNMREAVAITAGFYGIDIQTVRRYLRYKWSGSVFVQPDGFEQVCACAHDIYKCLVAKQTITNL